MPARLFLIFAILGCQPAFASGGLHCTGDGGATFEVNGGVTRGMGGPLFSFEGVLEIADKNIAPDLSRTTFERDHVAQYWLDGQDLRLVLYREREGDKPHGYVELTITTKAHAGDEEGSYDGGYALSIFDTTDDNSITIEREGAVFCSVE